MTEQPGGAPEKAIRPPPARVAPPGVARRGGVIRGVFNSAVVVVATILGAVAALLSRIVDGSGDSVLWLARLWARIIAALTGVTVAVESRARLDPARPYVFMSNHLSAVDIWAVLVALPVPVRMIAKKQLAAIPLLGWAMWAGRFIFIDRHNPASARRSLEKAKDRIRNGQSVLLFPEGTRSRDGRLLPFKKGGFHLAIDAGVSIVPVALAGTNLAMPPGSLLLRPGRARVTIGEPIATDGLGGRDAEALMERVRQAIEAMLADQ